MTHNFSSGNLDKNGIRNEDRNRNQNDNEIENLTYNLLLNGAWHCSTVGLFLVDQKIKPDSFLCVGFELLNYLSFPV